MKYVIKNWVTENITHLAGALNTEELKKKKKGFKDFILPMYSPGIVWRGNFRILLRAFEGLLHT